MRKFVFEKYNREKMKRYYEYFKELEPKDNICRRPRCKKDKELLLKLARFRLKNWIKNGKLVIINNRKFKFVIS